MSTSASDSNPLHQLANCASMRPRGGGYSLRENPKKNSRISNSEFVDMELIAWDKEINAACHLVQLSKHLGSTFNSCQGQQQLGRMETSDSQPSGVNVPGSSGTVTLGQDEMTRKNFVCDVCAKQFSSHWALGGHKSGHTKGAASTSRSCNPTPERLDAPPLPSPRQSN